MSPLRSSLAIGAQPGAPDNDTRPDPEPADAGPGAPDGPVARPRLRWRTSDKIGMGTFSVTTVSAYLLWSVIQGQDDLRRDVRRVADEQTLYAVAQERIGDTQRQLAERLQSHEAQMVVRFSDMDGRLGAVRRNQEDAARELRDHDQRLRIIETERAAPHRAAAP